jgi:hypothetical protein
MCVLVRSTHRVRVDQALTSMSCKVRVALANPGGDPWKITDNQLRACFKVRVAVDRARACPPSHAHIPAFFPGVR